MIGSFRSYLQAGFEPAHLPFGRGDLLAATGHTPERHMARHYAIVRDLGIRTIRDGLPWRHDPLPRLLAAKRAGLQVCWDLVHFDPPPLDAEAHARRIAHAVQQALSAHSTLWVCPVNEPAICSSFNPGFSALELAQAGIEMMHVLQSEIRDVRCMTTDPIVGAGEDEYLATDVMVSTGLVSVVGVNFYPHTAKRPLYDVVMATWKRYGLPVSLSETSWHNGHPHHEGLYPGLGKAGWMRQVLRELDHAQRDGAKVVGCCWYPATDTPDWDGSDAVWDNGLLRLDAAGVDEGLAAVFREQIRRAA